MEGRVGISYSVPVVIADELAAMTPNTPGFQTLGVVKWKVPETITTIRITTCYVRWKVTRVPIEFRATTGPIRCVITRS